MALKLSQNIDRSIPGVVKAIVAKKTDSLQHQAVSKIHNTEQISKASRFLNRMHNE